MNKDNLIQEIFNEASKGEGFVFFKFAVADLIDEYIEPATEIQDRLNRLELDYEELEDQYADLEEENERLVAKISDLENNLTAYATEMEAYENELQTLRNV